jgi:hypothetical protein
MRWALLVFGAAMMAGSGLGLQEADRGQPEARLEVGPRFKAIDIFIDSGETPLGAYQVEVKADTPADGRATLPKVTLVGVEGGEHAAYRAPPHYDPAALHEDQLRDRIILAAFNTGADLPTGKTRIARIQVQVEGPDPVYSVVVKAAGAADGTKINATGTAVAAGEVR